MGLRFQRRIKLFPGIRLNLSRSGVSTSIGRRGAWLTIGPRGQRRETIGIPGTGLRYTEQQSSGADRHDMQPTSDQDAVQQLHGLSGFAGLVVALVVTAGLGYLLFKFLG